MDFIERLFGISPDGGSGLTELLYIVAIVGVVVAVKYRSDIGLLLKRFRGR